MITFFVALEVRVRLACKIFTHHLALLRLEHQLTEQHPANIREHLHKLRQKTSDVLDPLELLWTRLPGTPSHEWRELRDVLRQRIGTG
jgi:hypothetical protein